MQFIKNKEIIDCLNWKRFKDDETLSSKKAIVSLTRWQNEKTQLLASQESVGVTLFACDDVSLLENDIDKLALIELQFTDFADGRLFSFAYLIRQRYGFKGELRAAGQYLPDQANYLSRVGVDTFIETHLPFTLEAIDDFSVMYQ